MGQIVSRIEQHHRVTAGIFKNCLFNVFLLALSWFPQQKKKKEAKLITFGLSLNTEKHIWKQILHKLMPVMINYIDNSIGPHLIIFEFSFCSVTLPLQAIVKERMSCSKELSDSGSFMAWVSIAEQFL